MDLLGDIDNVPVRLEILKLMLASVVSNAEVLQLVQDEINRLTEEGIISNNDNSNDDVADSFNDIDISYNEPTDFDTSSGIEASPELNSNVKSPEETILPTPTELNPDVDFSDNTQIP